MDASLPVEHRRWELDVSGFVVIRGVLSAQELLHFRAALAVGDDDGLHALTQHPALVTQLEQLCFEPQSYHLPEDPQPSFKLDRPLKTLEPAAPNESLRGGFEESLATGRDYVGVRRCHGVHAVWALADSEALILVPASHKPGVLTPRDVKTSRGAALAESLQLTMRPKLSAGDLLLFVSGLLHTVRPRTEAAQENDASLLLSCTYASAMARHNPAFREPLVAKELPPPAFWAELNATQLAVLQGDSTVAPQGVLEAHGHMQREVVHHPAAWCHVPSEAARTGAVDVLEQWQWDLSGYLLVKRVLSPEVVAAANAGLDYMAPAPRTVSRFLGPDTFDPTRSTDVRGGLLTLTPPYCEPFQKMFAHEAVISRLRWMMGDSFRCSGLPLGAIIMDAAGHDLGQELHGGNHWSVESSADFHSYQLLHGVTTCTDAVNIAFQLADSPSGAGGFVVRISSHATPPSAHTDISMWTCSAPRSTHRSCQARTRAPWVYRPQVRRTRAVGLSSRRD